MTGKFIAIEGLDGTGKSTLMPELIKHLAATQLECPPQLACPRAIG